MTTSAPIGATPRPSTVARTAAVALTALATVVCVGSATEAHAAPVHRGATAGTSGSIVFTKGYDVYIARGDGSHVRRVTRDGTKARAYHSPSESDAGTIAVAHGSLIVRMDQHGTVLNRIDPPALRNSAGEPMDGAVNDVAISPNGRTVAWSFVRYSCPIGADCLVRYATGYTAATHLTHAGRSTYYRAASWVGNTRTLQTGGSGSQVMIHDIARAPRHWFDDSDITFPSTDLADGELSPDGHWLAQIRGYDATSAVSWYRVTGNARAGAVPATPEWTCFTNGDRTHASPTWSPDSSALAWAGADGIWIQHSVGTCPQPHLAIRGGSSPDWSPAPLR